MRGVSESLAGRVGLLDLFPLSQNELHNITSTAARCRQLVNIKSIAEENGTLYPLEIKKTSSAPNSLIDSLLKKFKAGSADCSALCVFNCEKGKQKEYCTNNEFAEY